MSDLPLLATDMPTRGGQNLASPAGRRGAVPRLLPFLPFLYQYQPLDTILFLETCTVKSPEKWLTKNVT